MNEKPWLTYPQLTEEKLIIVAQLISKARREVAMLYEPEKGDRPWDRGCRAYSRSIFGIREAAKKYSWLVPITDESSLEFIFKIAGAPVRFCKAVDEEIPSKYLQQAAGETGWLALEFEQPTEVILRMVIHTKANGEASRIVLTEITDGVVTGEYVIPQVLPGTKPMAPPKHGPVVLPPPQFGLKKDEQKKKDNIGNDNIS